MRGISNIRISTDTTLIVLGEYHPEYLSYELRKLSLVRCCFGTKNPIQKWQNEIMNEKFRSPFRFAVRCCREMMAKSG